MHAEQWPNFQLTAAWLKFYEIVWGYKIAKQIILWYRRFIAHGYNTDVRECCLNKTMVYAKFSAPAKAVL